MKGAGGIGVDDLTAVVNWQIVVLIAPQAHAVVMLETEADRIHHA